MDTPKPLPTKKTEISFWNGVKIAVMTIASPILWGSMILAGLHIFVFWIHVVFDKGLFDPTTIQYSVLVAVGAYFCLIVDKDKIVEALNIRRDVKVISPEKRSE